MGVSVSGTTDQKMYLKKFRGGCSPLRPPPGSAYGSLNQIATASKQDAKKGNHVCNAVLLSLYLG